MNLPIQPATRARPPASPGEPLLFDIVIELDRWALRQLYLRPPTPNFHLHQDGPRPVFRAQATPEQLWDISRWMYSVGRHITVHSPAFLKDVTEMFFGPGPGSREQSLSA